MIVHVLRYNKQLPGQFGARPFLHNTRVGGMESSSPAALDPEGYVEKFLEMYYPGLNVRHAGHKLLMLREHPTSRGVQLASKTTALTLHPDKSLFTTWMQHYFKEVDLEVVMKAKLKLAAFWMQVQQTKESLIQFDEGYYQQVPATHPHTPDTQRHLEPESQMKCVDWYDSWTMTPQCARAVR